MNDYFVVSHVPRPVSHVPGPVSHVPGLERAILKGTGTGPFFGGQERVTVRSVPEKNFRNAFLSVPQNQERVPERV